MRPTQDRGRLRLPRGYIFSLISTHIFVQPNQSRNAMHKCFCILYYIAKVSQHFTSTLFNKMLESKRWNKTRPKSYYNNSSQSNTKILCKKHFYRNLLFSKLRPLFWHPCFPAKNFHLLFSMGYLRANILITDLE